MKPTKVNLKNREKIEADLALVNGRSHAHTLNSFEQIWEMAEDASRRLVDLRLPRGRWVGAEFVAQSGAPVSSGYRYLRTGGTEIRLIRRASGWFLSGIRLVGIWEKGGNRKLRLTPEQRDYAIAEFSRKFEVI